MTFELRPPPHRNNVIFSIIMVVIVNEQFGMIKFGVIKLVKEREKVRSAMMHCHVYYL